MSNDANNEPNVPENEPNVPEDVSQLSNEQLESTLEGMDFGHEDEAAFNNQEVGDKPEAEGEEEEAEESTEEEAQEADDSEEDAEAEEEGEEQEEESEEDSNLDPAVRSQIEGVLQRLEVMEAERERLNAELERERLLRDRNAGKLGALMQKLEQTRDREAADDLDDEDSADDAKRQSRSEDPRDEELREIRTERVQRAINDTSAEFLQDNASFFNALLKEAGEEAAGKFQADLVAKIKSHQESLGEDIFSMSPKIAAKVAKTVIQSAFADVKLELMREYQRRAAEKSEASRKNIRARKKGAAGVRSNKRAAAGKARTKSLSDMSDSELEAALAEASFDE